MNWEGNISWSGGGGSRVRVGDHYVPSSVTMHASGSNGAPDLLFEFRMDANGAARCIKAHVDAKPDGRGIATADLAFVAIDQLTVTAFEQLAQEILYEREEGIATAYAGPINGDRGIRRAVDRGRQSKIGELATVARVYLEAERAPMRAVEDRLGYNSRRTAARRIEQARAQGLLPVAGEKPSQDHLDAIERVLAAESDAGPDSFASPAEFEAWYANQFKGDGNE
ncbi:hypothetical protein [Demequina capsici]|uniref:Uncharacterized protein n=1 Tax=Demequina capsici TaxID=3075620 RepID=A0AA96JEH0_9MICO|nr:hypothetical protein [Demequina sp. OYTSA14]WNM25649.1 hypothetical protein RN606_05730 [Demequina sp. OYTSA14]